MMSKHNLYLNCVHCNKIESIYTGDVFPEYFTNHEWEANSSKQFAINATARSGIVRKQVIRNNHSQIGTTHPLLLVGVFF